MYFKIIVIILFIIKNDYYINLKNPLNLMNNGIIGGNPSNYLNLSSNNFMVTFWFKFNDIINNIFPYITIFNDNIIINQYTIIKNDQVLIENNSNKLISINKSINYFCKFEYITKNYTNTYTNLILYTNYTTPIWNIENNLNKAININNINFIINKLNLKEDLIIENMVFYNSINKYTLEDLINGVSNILYFINFKNNYPFTKFFSNEIKNEFGPALNGNNEKMINMISSNFNDDNEIEWLFSNKDSYLTLNPLITNYLYNFKLDFSANIFLKLNFLLSFKNQNINNSGYIDILFFFSNILSINYNYNFSLKTLKIEFLIKIYNHKYLILSKIINDLNFIDNGDFKLNFLIINITKNNKQLDRSSFNSMFYFNNNSVFCNNNCLLKYNYTGLNIFNKNHIKIYFENNLDIKILFIMKLYEFTLGKGNLKIDNLLNNNFIIKSNNIENKFIIFDSLIKNWERRFSFNDNIPHKLCIAYKCSICRKDLNICEFCVNGYYLDNNKNCIHNNDINKFVNNYSELKNILYQKSSYNSLYKNSKKFYTITFPIPAISNYHIFFIWIFLKNDTIQNINVNLFASACLNNFNIFKTKIDTIQTDFNSVIITNDINCINFFRIYNLNNLNNNNDLVNFEIYINKLNINNVNFKDIFCEFRQGTNYLLKFDDSLTNSLCLNNNIDYYYKNSAPFLYYYNCPKYCIECEINSNNLWKCTKCIEGFNLNNDQCIMDMVTNCTKKLNYKFNINQNISIFNCEINCNSYGNDKIFLNKFYKVKIKCNNNLIISCQDNKKYYNYYTNRCESCWNNNCINFICNNCNNTNNNSPCSNGYKFFRNKCVLNENFDLNCSNYILINNFYKCSKCYKNYYISIGNKCLIRNTINCLTYLTNSNSCIICNIGFYLDSNNTCLKCNKYCKSCISKSDYCLSCFEGFIKINNKCNISNNYLLNCLMFDSFNKCIGCKIGYYLNNLNICLNCIDNCDICNNNKDCITCKINYFLDNNKKCYKNHKFCYKQEMLKCKQCYLGYFINNKYECSKCSTNCLSCKNKADNCVLCNINGQRLKKLDNSYYCRYKCLDSQIFDLNTNKCTKCIIKFVKKYSYNIKSETKMYNFFKEIKTSYFLILSIPKYLQSNFITNKNLKNNINIYINNKYKLDYEIFIDFKYNKVLIIPYFFTKLIKFKILLLIKENIFYNFKMCNFIKNKFSFSIKLNKISNNKNEFKIKSQKIFPKIPEDSKEYIKLNNYYESAKIATETIFIGTFIFSFFSPSLIARLSVLMQTLIFFNYLTILKIDYGVYLNTIFGFINFNSSFLNLATYLFVDEKIINNKIEKLIIKNYKLLKLKLLFINNITWNYWLLLCFLTIIIICRFIIYCLLLIKNIIINCKLRKKKLKTKIIKEVLNEKIQSLLN